MRFFNLIKKTEPLVIHFNSSIKEVLNEKKFYDGISKSSNNISKIDNLTVITFAFGSNINNFPLIKQLNNNKIDFINLVEHLDVHKWDNLLKISLLNKYLQNNEIKNKYIVVLDSIDVVLSDKFNEIIDMFKKTDCKILYGAGQNRYPNIPINGETNEVSRYPNRWLNAGTVIAEVEYLKDFLFECNKNIGVKDNLWKSEQYIIRKTLIGYKYKYLIDYDSKCSIFQTMDKTNFEIKNNCLLIK